MDVNEFVKDFEAKLRESETLQATIDALRTEEIALKEEVNALEVKLKATQEMFSKAIEAEKSKLTEIQNNHARVISQEDIRISKQNIESDANKQSAERLLSEAKQKTNFINEQLDKLRKDSTKLEQDRAKLNIEMRDFDEKNTNLILQQAQYKQDIEKLASDKKDFAKEKEDIANVYKSINEETRKNNILVSENKKILADIEVKTEENKKLFAELDIKNADFKVQNENLDARKTYLDKKEENLKAKESNLNKLQQEAAFQIANAQKKELEAEEMKKQLAFELAQLKKKANKK